MNRFVRGGWSLAMAFESTEDRAVRSCGRAVGRDQPDALGPPSGTDILTAPAQKALGPLAAAQVDNLARFARSDRAT